MNKNGPTPLVNSDMTVLDVVHGFPLCQEVFREYDEKLGKCIMCESLFEKIKDLPKFYDLNLDELLKRLESRALSEKQE